MRVITQVDQQNKEIIAIIYVYFFYFETKYILETKF